MKRAAAVGLALLCSSTVTTQQTGLTDAQRKAADLEVPQLVSLLDLKPGMTVADVGAGFGAWTMRFSSWIGPSGRVYATDLGTPQLAALREAVQRDKLANVTVIEGATASTNLPPLCCDAILVRDAYHHFAQPVDMVRSLTAALKPGGRLAIIDFPPRPASETPAGVPANRGGHGVPPEVVQREVGASLTYVRTIEKWAPDGQPANLFLVLFRKP
jgi:ubiquinone/menaquinone biosynthesis C-methylase UbiE